MHKKIFLLSLPLVFSNLVLPSVGIVNTALIGHLNNSSYLAAIGLGVSIVNCICFLFAFFRMSLTGLVAQSIHNDEEIFAIVIKAMIVASIIAFVVFVTKGIILSCLLKIVDVEADVRALFIGFYNVAIYIFWFALVNYVFIGFFIGIGKPKLVLYSSIILMLVTVSLSVFFVVVMRYNIIGVAISLILGYLATSAFLAINVYTYFAKQKLFSRRVFGKMNLLELQTYLPFLKLNTNIFIRSICLLLAMNSFYFFSAKYGKDVLAANTILVEIGMFVAMFLEALANTTESLVAKAYVEKNQKLFREVITKTLQQSILVIIAIVMIYAYFDTYIISMFTSIVDVKLQINKYILFSIFLPLVSGISFWIDGVFVGLLKTIAMRNAMIISALVYIMSVILLEYYGNYGLWVALILFYIARTGLLMIPLNRYLKRGV